MDVSKFKAQVDAAKALATKAFGGGLGTARAGHDEAKKLYEGSRKTVVEALRRQGGQGR